MRRVLFVVMLLGARAASGQAFDVTIGPGTARGGEYAERTGGHIEMILAPARERFVLALGARFNPASGDVCHLDVTRTRCVPRFPSLVHLGLLGAASYGPVRALAGPAVYAGTGRPGVGGQLHVDAAGGFAHVAGLVAARGGLIFRRGETLSTGSLEFGIRLR